MIDPSLYFRILRIREGNPIPVNDNFCAVFEVEAQNEEVLRSFWKFVTNGIVGLACIDLKAISRKAHNDHVGLCRLHCAVVLRPFDYSRLEVNNKRTETKL